jgi:hypothetical protein
MTCVRSTRDSWTSAGILGVVVGGYESFVLVREGADLDL